MQIYRFIDIKKISTSCKLKEIVRSIIPPNFEICKSNCFPENGMNLTKAQILNQIWKTSDMADYTTSIPLFLSNSRLFSRSLYFWIFPLAVIGNSSTKKTN